MDVHTEVELKQAFVATEEVVSKIWSIIEDSEMEVTGTMRCSDEMVRHIENVDSLTQYENPNRASIKSLQIQGRSLNPSASVHVYLGERQRSPVSFSIRGEENAVHSIRTTLSDLVSGIKPWYSWLSTIDLFYVWLPFFGMLFMLLTIMSNSDTPSPDIPFKKALALLAFSIALFGAITIIVRGIGFLHRRYFPRATFAIGQGLVRHQADETIRWIVFVGFLVSVTASVLVVFLSSV